MDNPLLTRDSTEMLHKKGGGAEGEKYFRVCSNHLYWLATWNLILYIETMLCIFIFPFTLVIGIFLSLNNSPSLKKIMNPH